MDVQDQQNLLIDNEMSRHKKHKKRIRNLLMQVKEQIEFYFSDANLHKDRFLNQQIRKHPDRYVAISTVASFNRMKQKTDDIGLVIKAMKMSSLLEVGEDDTMVRRKAPVPEPRNVDKETIYVENLPPYADHSWVKDVFSKCGTVLYVSIPRFKHNGEIKGFAFVEFETPAQAEEAVQMFNKGTKQSELAAENDSSADQFNDQHKAKGKRKRSHSESEVDSQRHKEQKRKRTTSETSVDLGEQEQLISTSSSLAVKEKCKEMKTEAEHEEKECRTKRKERKMEGSVDDQENRHKRGRKSVRWDEEKEKSKDSKERNEDSEVSSTTGVKRLREQSDSEDDEHDERKRKRASHDSWCNAQQVDGENSSGDEGGKANKKQKKRKRKKKEKKEHRLPHLRVIPKLEWLELKKEYKNLQRQAMKNLKQQLQEKTVNDPNQEETQEQTKPLETPDRNIGGKEHVHKKNGQGLKELSYTPGVVLKFESKEKRIAKKELREKFSSLAPVAYLDLADGSTQGYVRFFTPESSTLVWNKMSSSSPEFTVDQLTEEEEKSYWEKINADRKARFNSKREKKRGTEKVAKKADAFQVKIQSHIRFDDAEDELET